MILVSDKGLEFRIANLLGRGGEGAAYLLAGAPGVAKIYHHPLNDTQVSKLSVMTRLGDEVLLANGAWPKDIIYKKGENRACGFVMPLVRGSELHEIYGPASRKQKLPEATWEHLIQIARNIACVFDVFHSRNIVIGDVNEKNIFVQDNGKACLVDCDSYQVTSNGTVFPCRVGVPLYTPPELQGMHLAQTHRNSQHDSFGLAVLIFQLLFMGRHPFAGVTRGTQYLAIENGDAIKAGLYAYGKDAHRSGVTPPPNTLPINALTPEVQDLFELSFKKHLNGQGRPSAAQWVNTLDVFRKKIVTCRVEKSHKYSHHLSECPWCLLTKKSGVSFFLCVSFSNYVEVRGTDVAAFKQAIDKLREESFFVSPLVDFAKTFAPTPLPVPKSMIGFSKEFYWGILVIGGSCLLGFLLPMLFWGIWVGIVMMSSGKHKPEYKQEMNRRKTRFDQFKHQVTALHAELQTTVSNYQTQYHQMRSRLDGAFKSYVNLPQERLNQIRVLEEKKRQLQLEAFLDKFLIAQHKIHGIGPAREKMLISYGVETAADITESKVMVIPGFRDSLFEKLQRWRAHQASKFVYDATRPIPQVEMDALNKRFTDLKMRLQEEQRTLLRKLVDAGNGAKVRSQELTSRLEAYSRELKQCEASYKIFS